MAIKIKSPALAPVPAPKLIDKLTDGTLTMEVYEHDASPPVGKPQAYRINSLARCSHDGAALNEIVFKCLKSDYGCASDDTNMYGVMYIAVTFKPDGDYPFFTIPLKDLTPKESQ